MTTDKALIDLPCGATARFDPNASGGGMVCDVCFVTVGSPHHRGECREAWDRREREREASDV